MNRRLTFLILMLLGYGSASSSQTKELKTGIEPHAFLTKEELVSAGVLPDTIFTNSTGQVRTLEDGEVVEVQNHEENNTLSFSTFDNYSIVVPRQEIQAPRNVSGETGI